MRKKKGKGRLAGVAREVACVSRVARENRAIIKAPRDREAPLGQS